jgi:glutathione peroxidase
MKKFLPIIFLLASVAGFSQTKSYYDFKVTDIHGKTFDFATLKDKKVLIVNTASECSLAPQLKKLQELYEEYGGEDFEIIAFPSNDFGNREPGNNEQILKIYTEKFGISFPIMAKSSVKGDEMNPVYQWLTNSQENGTLDAKVMWNFQKFLVDDDGQVVDVVWPIGSPKSKRIEEWLQEGL